MIGAGVVVLALLLALFIEGREESARPTSSPAPLPEGDQAQDGHGARTPTRRSQRPVGRSSEVARPQGRTPSAAGRAPIAGREKKAVVVLDERTQARIDDVESLMENPCIQQRSPDLIRLAEHVVGPLNLAIQDGDEGMVRDVLEFLGVVERELLEEEARCPPI